MVAHCGTESRAEEQEKIRTHLDGATRRFDGIHLVG
jgi:hypothetical protein